MVVCVFLSSTAPPSTSVATEGDNKTCSVIREIISQSSCDLQAKPEVKETQTRLLPRCFPMKISQEAQLRSKCILGSLWADSFQSQHMRFFACIPGSLRYGWECEWGSQWTQCRVCPGRLWWKSTLPASCGERKCYRRCPLIAGYPGRAEGGRQSREGRGRGGSRGAGGRSCRLNKGRGLKRLTGLWLMFYRVTFWH